jgi:hypothetical protein
VLPLEAVCIAADTRRQKWDLRDLEGVSDTYFLCSHHPRKHLASVPQDAMSKSWLRTSTTVLGLSLPARTSKQAKAHIWNQTRALQSRAELSQLISAL